MLAILSLIYTFTFMVGRGTGPALASGMSLTVAQCACSHEFLMTYTLRSSCAVLLRYIQ